MHRHLLGRSGPQSGVTLGTVKRQGSKTDNQVTASKHRDIMIHSIQPVTKLFVRGTITQLIWTFHCKLRNA